jgi:ABC-type lipoprotein release transport system permease subunit
MKLEEINNRTKDAVNHLVEALESGQSAASFLPARRAASVNPVDALRAE